MLGKNHVKVNLSYYALLYMLAPSLFLILFSETRVLASIVMVVIGSLLPDIDTRYGLINKNNPALTGMTKVARKSSGCLTTIIFCFAGGYLLYKTNMLWGKMTYFIVALVLLLPYFFIVEKRVSEYFSKMAYSVFFLLLGGLLLYHGLWLNFNLIFIILGVLSIFVVFTKHRGLFHTLDGALFVCLALYYVFNGIGQSELFPPLAFGYVCHLLVGDILTPTGITVSFLLPILSFGKIKEKNVSLNVFVVGSEGEMLYSFMVMASAIALGFFM